MIRFIRILTFLVAIILLIISVFHVNTGRELALARQAYRSNDMDQTIRLARRVIFAASNNNNKTKAFFLLAKASAKMEHADLAKKSLDRLLKADSQNIRALLFRGELEYLLGDYQQAIADLDKGLDGAKDLLSKNQKSYYYTQRGLAYLAIKQTENAEKDASIALDLNFGLPEAWDLESRVLETSGNIKGALKACEKAYHLSIDRDKLSFMTPKGQKLSDRLVKLKVQYLMKNR